MIQGRVQTSNCTVGCGLYVCRYVDSGDGALAPVAWVRPASGYEHAISIISAPGLVAGRLDRPGAALVVVSQAPGLLEISVDATQGSHTPNAQFALELLSTGLIGSVARSTAPADPAPLGEPLPRQGQPGASHMLSPRSADARAGLEIMGHVSRFGDVAVAAGEWIAGPDAPSPIEGLSVRSSTESLSVVAQFTNSLRADRWSPWQPAEFVGTRQQASPLMGLKLRLDGVRAAEYNLAAEALFLGSPVVSAEGQEVILISASGLDPLVGLRLDLREIGKVDAPLPDVKSSRVRVFRTSERSI